MKKVSVVTLVALHVVALLTTASTAGAESRFQGRGGGRFNGGHAFAHRQSFNGRGNAFHSRGFGHHRSFPRHFVGFGAVLAPPLVVYSSPLFADSSFYDRTPVYDPPPVYSPPPAYGVGPGYNQLAATVYNPPAYAPPAPPPPTPRVVEYPTGRYELRGDGTAAPYTWVWIPNPPPPPSAPPSVPQGPPPASLEPQPARQSQAYRWVDDQGVVHWTNRLETVPARFRAQVSRLEPS